eukprot:5292888-Amphidinium_carterae.2
MIVARAFNKCVVNDGHILQWHLNEFSAITMLNTRSMSNAFGNWCDQSNPTAVLNKYLEAVGRWRNQATICHCGQWCGT